MGAPSGTAWLRSKNESQCIVRFGRIVMRPARFRRSENPNSVPPRGRRWPRRVAIGSIVVVALVAALFAAQTWRVIDAIEQAQDAVVPLPTQTNTSAVAPTPAALPAPPRLTTAPMALNNDHEAPPTAAVPVRNRPPSAVEIASQLLIAGLDRGDPGRSEVWAGRTSVNVLVLGVDRRPDGGDQNADVIILAKVDLVNKRLAAVSIPRDLLVEIPGVGEDRVNSAYNHGVRSDPDDPVAGVAKVRDTLQHNFGVPVDHYLLVDFAGFEGVVDAVGGIEIDVPEAIHDPAYPRPDYGTEVVDFAAGREHMNGERALKYARTRNADSDDQRRDRQLQVIMALFERGKRLGSITTADDMIVALSDSVQTGFNLEQQLLLARVAYQLDQSDIRMTTLGEPLVTPATTDAGAWVYVADRAELADFIHDALDTEAGGD